MTNAAIWAIVMAALVFAIEDYPGAGDRYPTLCRGIAVAIAPVSTNNRSR